MAGSIKHVHVSVDNEGKVTCSPDPVKVQGANALIVFKMTSAGWTFTEANAITVENPGTDFPYPSWTIKPTTAVLLDLDNVKGDYSYCVSVVQVSTGKQFLGDPTIQNEG
ncbi:MAG TPA: hypothetical protein VD932_01965 [Aquabacterium sp.]|nr:hypothetical protein [Aquabacterium sp.]